MALNSVPALGEFEYNGITFTAATRSTVSSRPVYDEAGRVVTHVEQSYDVISYLSSTDVAAGVDDDWEHVYQRLTEPGAAFKFRERGFGSEFQVNVEANGVRDVAWGPKPAMIAWTPIGGGQAVLFQWRLTVCVPICDSVPRYKGLMTYNYTWGVDIDQDGYRTIATTGYIEIAQTRTRAGRRDVKDSADAYWHLVHFSPPLGFRQQSARRQLSADRRRLDFAIVHVEVPMPLPPGVTEAQGTQYVESGLSEGFLRWTGGLSGRIIMEAGRPKKEALDVVLAIIASRVFVPVMSRFRLPGERQPGQQPQPGHFFLPTRFRLEDDLFGRGTSFSFSYDILNCSLENIVEASGLWRPILGADAEAWRESLRDGAWGPHGNGMLAWDPQKDILLDLCTNQDPVPPFIDEPGQRIVHGKGGKAADRMPRVPPEASWLWYEIALQIEQETRWAPHSVVGGLLALGGPATIAAGWTKFQKNAQQLGENLALWAMGDQRQHTLYQQQGAPVCKVVLTGRAIRLQYPINPPRLVQIEDMRLHQKGPMPRDASNVFVESKIELAQSKAGARMLGIPVSGLAWRIEYLLPRAPQHGQGLDNPMLQVTGTPGDAEPKLT